MKQLTLSAFGLLAALLTTSAFAAEQPTPPAGGHEGKPPMQRMFDDRDTNNDGAISKEEWTARGDKMFAEIDANKDGKITLEESKAHHEAKRAEWKERKAELGKPDGKPSDAPKPAEKK